MKELDVVNLDYLIGSQWCPVGALWRPDGTRWVPLDVLRSHRIHTYHDRCGFGLSLGISGCLRGSLGRPGHVHGYLLGATWGLMMLFGKPYRSLIGPDWALRRLSEQLLQSKHM